MAVDVQARRLVDLPITPTGWEWAATGVGPDFAVVLLAADTPFDARRAGRSSRYRLYRWTVGSFDVFEFQHEGPAAYMHVQPIDDGNFLLVTPGIYEAMRDKRNGDVWNSEGRLVRKIPLGDGISHVQVSARSEVWVGYHDEGVYGAGEPGLACFDRAGTRVFSFASVVDDDRAPVIDDCYALNVASDDDVWVYYYKAFPLVRLVDKRFEAIWPDTPGLGAHAFAVGERSVIFAGDYGAPSSITQYFPESGRSEMGHAIADGQQLEFTRAMGRADRLYLVANSAIWLVQAD